MDADFWGLLILPGKKYCNEAHKPIRVTTACFGEKVVKDSRSCVYLIIKDKEFVLCVLTKNESQSLDVYLPTEAEFSFRVSGPNEVHLTGHIVSPPEDYEYDSGSDPDELMQSITRGEFDSDDDDDDFSYEEEDSHDSSLDEANIEEIEVQKEQPKLKKKEKKHKTSKETKKESKKVQPVATPAQSGLSKKIQPVVTPAPDAQSGLSKKDKKKLAKQEGAKAPEVSSKKGDAPKRKSEDLAPSNKKAKAETTNPQQKAPEAKQAPPQKGAKTFPNGLVIDDKVIGDGRTAKKGQTVQMRYIGKLKNGKVFDSNSAGPAFSFRLGAGEVIRGWDLGIEGMKVGGERRLTIPPELAYGKRGVGRDIPGNATLSFEVKLLSIK